MTAIQNQSQLPRLENWRAIGRSESTESRGIFVAQFYGHPYIASGEWSTSSAIIEMDNTETWARCASREYRLGTPWPRDQRLPPEARDAIFIRILRNATVQFGNELPLETLKVLEVFTNMTAGWAPPTDLESGDLNLDGTATIYWENG